MSKASTDLCLPADCTELQSLKIISSAGTVYFSRPLLFPLARTQLSFLPDLSTGRKCFGVWFLLFTSLCILVCSSTSNSVPLSGWCHHQPADEDETPSRGDPLPRRGQQDLPQRLSLVPRAAEKSRLAHVVPQFLFSVSKWIQVWRVLNWKKVCHNHYYCLEHSSVFCVPAGFRRQLCYLAVSK